MTDLNSILLPFLTGVQPLQCKTKEECVWYLEVGSKYCTYQKTIRTPLEDPGSRHSSVFAFHLDHSGHIYTNFQCNVSFRLELGGQQVGQLKRLPICLLKWQHATVVIDLAEQTTFDDIVFSYDCHVLANTILAAVLNKKAVLDGPVLYMGGMAKVV